MLTASDDKTARIWDTQSAAEILKLTGHAWGVRSAAFSRNGQFVITGSDDNSARVWDAETGDLLQILGGHTAAVTSGAFSPEGDRALTASEDFTAKLWDTSKIRETWDANDGQEVEGKEILNLRGHSQTVTSARFSDDGFTALTGSRDGTAVLWLTTDWRTVESGE